jgi:hypothetical protein
MAETGVTRQQAVQFALENARRAKFNINGTEYVTTIDGSQMPAYRWQAMKNPPPLFGMPQALAAANNPNIDVSKVAPSTGIGKPAAPAAGTPFTPAPTAMNAIEQDAASNARSAPGMQNAQAMTVKAQQELSEAANNAQSTGRNLTNLAVAVSGLNENGFLSGGPLDNLIIPAASTFNYLMRLGGKPELQFSPEEMTKKIEAGKLAAGQQLAMTTAAGQTAYRALEVASNAIPGKGIDRNTSLELTANLMIDKQRALDEQRYENFARQSVSNPNAYNADVARQQFRSQYSDEKYQIEKRALVNLLSKTDANGKSLINELMSGQITRRDVEEALGMPGITRYLYSE